MLIGVVFYILIVLQITDTALTYYGVRYTIVGNQYEINPVLLYLIKNLGLELGLFPYKIIAIFLTWLVYLRLDCNRIFITTSLILLTVCYLYVLYRHYLVLKILVEISGWWILSQLLFVSLKVIHSPWLIYSRHLL